MIESFKTIYENSIAEIIIKKSKFIAHAMPVESEEHALNFIEQIKKKYWDATHNCFAYVIGNNSQIMRCNDDGEPSRTAGKPMLDVLLTQKLTNIVVVVTRYFGGTLLGTGGLVKAYQSAVIDNSSIINKKLGHHIEITTDYNTIGKIQYYLANNEHTTLSSEYTDIVKINALISPSQLDTFNKKITEISNGSALLLEIEKVYYANINNTIHLFK